MEQLGLFELFPHGILVGLAALMVAAVVVIRAQEWEQAILVQELEAVLETQAKAAAVQAQAAGLVVVK